MLNLVTPEMKKYMQQALAAEHEGALMLLEMHGIHHSGTGMWEQNAAHDSSDPYEEAYAKVLACVDWSKGHKPVVLDYSKSATATLIVKSNLFISFINPPASKPLHLRLIHDDSANVYNLIWGGGIEVPNEGEVLPKYTAAVTWTSFRPNVFDTAKSIIGVSFVYENEAMQEHPVYLATWSKHLAGAGSSFLVEAMADNAAMVKEKMLMAWTKQWKLEHSAEAYVKKAYEVYCIECNAKGHQPASFSIWQDAYQKKLDKVEMKDVLGLLMKIDTQQGKQYDEPVKEMTPEPPKTKAGWTSVKAPENAPPSQAQKVWKKLNMKIQDVSAAELQQQLLHSLGGVAAQKAQNEDVSQKAYQATTLAGKQMLSKAQVAKEEQALINQKIAGMIEKLKAVSEPVKAEEVELADLDKVKDMFKVEVRLFKDGYQYRVWFHTKVPSYIDADKLPVISLSKYYGNCMFRVDKFHEHDNHGGSFSKDEVKPFVLRVLKDTSARMLERKLITAEEVQDLEGLEFNIEKGG